MADKCTIRIKILSMDGCEPCSKMQKAVKEIVEEKDLDAEIFKIIPVKIGSKILAEFGEDVTVVPVTIIEREGEGGVSKKLVGFNRKELEEVIEEVRCK